ncbi:hypothetical protein C2W62_40420 [Candidatus Entotheonella serta]|nr:hypothetical protein C2W62_40420 [Candidatus Entotheonella serta]
MDNETVFDDPANLDASESAETSPLPGIIVELGRLGTNALISEGGLAHLFNRHVVSVKRAIGRGELPPPCKLFGANVWTVGVIIKHIESRLEMASQEAEAQAKRFKNLSPLPTRSRR